MATTSPVSVDAVDGITLIINDHRNVEEFFSRFEQASDADEQLRLVAKMIEELTTHAAIEERVLYPMIRERLDDGADLESHALEEHQEARQVLSELEHLPVTDDSFAEKVRTLIDEVRHHVEDEEQDHLPKLRDALSGDELRTLGDRLRSAKASAPVSPSQESGSQDGSSDASKDELYQRAQEKGVEGRSQMSKDELARQVGE